MNSHAQLLSTVRAWVPWLSQLYGQQYVQVYPGGTQTHQHQETCHSINKQMLAAAASVLSSANPESSVPPVIIQCAIQLLLSLSVMVRSPVALQMDQIQGLYTRAHQISSQEKVIIHFILFFIFFLGIKVFFILLTNMH